MGEKSSTWDPLGYCPEKDRKKYLKRAERASSGSLAAMIELFCISCMDWQPRLVKGCTDHRCPFFIRVRR